MHPKASCCSISASTPTLRPGHTPAAVVIRLAGPTNVQEPLAPAPTGPSLVGVSGTFANKEEMIDFISRGTEEGQTYGNQGIGQGGGQMPGFETIYTQEQIAAIVDYEWDLRSDTASPGYNLDGTPLPSAESDPDDDAGDEESDG